MKTHSRLSASQKLVSQVHLARIQLAKAEGQLATAKEVAQAARRRRKEAKQAARRAKKQARLAKREVNEAKLVLAKAEARLARLNRPPTKAKARTAPARKATGALVRKTPVRTTVGHSRAALTTAKRAVRRTRAKGAGRPIERSAKAPGTLSPELEMPVEVLPLSEHKPTPQIIQGVKEIFTQETSGPESLAAAAETSASPEPGGPALNDNVERI